MQLMAATQAIAQTPEDEAKRQNLIGTTKEQMRIIQDLIREKQQALGDT
jgi:hypothetical protein